MQEHFISLGMNGLMLYYMGYGVLTFLTGLVLTILLVIQESALTLLPMGCVDLPPPFFVCQTHSF